MSRLFQFVAWIALIGAMALVSLFFYWIIYPYKPLVILNHPLEIMDPEHSGIMITDPKVIPKYHVGDLFIYHVDYCKYDDTPTRVTRSFVDGIKYDLPTVTANNPKGCHELFPSFIIPNIPPGFYTMTIIYDKDVNPLRNWSYNTETYKFEVVR